MSYVLHFDFQSFAAQADTADAGIYLQDYGKTTHVGGIAAELTSQLVATYQDTRGSIHAARIVIERVGLFGDDPQVRAAVAARAQVALSIVRAALPGVTIQSGMLGVPGLLGDLATMQTEHQLWHWGDARDTINRRIVAGSEPTAHA